jgi:hypothetical protein
VVLGVRGQVFLNHLLGDEPDAAGPAFGRVVEDVVDLELVRVLGRELVEFGFQEDVRLVDVGVDQGDVGPVERVLGDGADQLLRVGREEVLVSVASDRNVRLADAPASG